MLQQLQVVPELRLVGITVAAFVGQVLLQDLEMIGLSTKRIMFSKMPGNDRLSLPAQAIQRRSCSLVSFFSTGALDEAIQLGRPIVDTTQSSRRSTCTRDGTNGYAFTSDLVGVVELPTPCVRVEDRQILVWYGSRCATWLARRCTRRCGGLRGS